MRGKGRPFEKLKSGNPTGRPKVDSDWKAWCRQFTADNRDHIKARALDDDRLLAFLIEQGHGKAHQSGDLQVEVGALENLTDEQLLARLAEAAKALKG